MALAPLLLKSLHEPFVTNYSRNTSPLSGCYIVLPTSTPEVGKKDDAYFDVSVKVGNYTPEDIKLNVEERTLIVTGERTSRQRRGFDKIRFERRYSLPDDADAASIRWQFKKADGSVILRIQAERKKELSDNDQTTQQADSQEFSATFDVRGFAPEQITVKLNDRRLIVHAEQRSDSDGGSFLSKQLTRHVALPRDVDVDQLKTELQNDGRLVVKAPRDPALLNTERILPIARPTDEEQ